MTLKHLAIIMDGNRRWARKKALKVFAGHDHGAQTLKNIARSVAEHGIQNLTVLPFSVKTGNVPSRNIRPAQP